MHARHDRALLLQASARRWLRDHPFSPQKGRILWILGNQSGRSRRRRRNPQPKQSRAWPSVRRTLGRPGRSRGGEGLSGGGNQL